ncbi:MAG: tetratricopeptide repeat protein, partial [Acidobacteriota bacterium]
SYEEAMRALRQLAEPEDADRAITVFRQMIEQDPASATAHAGLARAYWQKTRNASAGGDQVFLEQALAMAQEAVRLNSYLADARTSLGLVLSTLGRYDEAAEHLRTAIELEPTQADAHFGLGHLAMSLSRHDEAEGHFRRAVELEPTTPYLNSLGALLYDLGRYEAAERAFLDTLALDLDDLNALRNLGAIYHAQGRLEEAAAMLQVALKVRPDASLFSNLGTVFFSRGLYSQAAAAFQDALAMDGAANRFIFWLNLADAERQLPERAASAERGYRRAIQMLDDLIDARPTDVRLRSRRALALSRVGDLDTALDDIHFVRQEGTGGDLYSLFRLVVAEELGGEREGALATLAEALRAGFSIAEVRYEPDLVDLRADPRFHLLLVELDERAD